MTPPEAAPEDRAPREDRTREREALAEVGRVLGSNLEAAEALRHLARVARVHLGVETTRIWMQAEEAGPGAGVQPGWLGGGDETAPGPADPCVELAAIAMGAAGPVVITPIAGDPRVSEARWFAVRRVDSTLCVPIEVDGRRLGAMVCLARGRHAFSPGDLRLAIALAGCVAGTLRNARRLEEERQRARQAAALLEIARASTSALALRPLLREITRHAARALGAERCTVSLWQGGRLVPVMSQFADGHEAPELWARMKSLGEPGVEGVPADSRAMRLRQPVVIEDARASDLLPRSWVEAFDIRSLLVAPLIFEDRVLGTLGIDDRRGPRRWSPAERDLAMTIAAQAALAVDRTRQFEDAEQRAREIQTLSSVVETLASSRDPLQVMETIVDSAVALVGAQRAAVFEMDGEGECLRPRTVRGRLDPGAIVPLGQGAAGTAAATREAVWSADVTTRPLAGESRDDPGAAPGRAVPTGDYRGILAVPILRRDLVLGAVCVYWDRPHEVGPREIRLLGSLARHAAVAMENARLVADLRHTLEELRAVQEGLVRGATLRAVGELAAGVAHHLNNLMAIVLGRAQLLLLRDPPPAMAPSLRTIERAAQDAAEAVRRIEAFSRSSPQGDLMEVDLNAVVQEGIEFTRVRWDQEPRLRGAPIELRFEPGAVPPVLGGADELREVVSNLVLNAVDAMPSGGRIVVRTWVESARATVSIGDSGVGMTEEEQRRAFEPFYTTKGVKSTGLGLAVAYGTLRRHGGRISVESLPGQGTTVRFWLPLAGTGAEPRIARAERPCSVLVVDDEIEVRELVADVLSARGHLVTVAGGGREGIERLETGRFDLVITDLGMPDVTGWEVARVARRLEPDRPVLLLTGWSDGVDAPEGPRVDGVMTKPFEVSRLVEAVRAALGGSPDPADRSAFP